MEFVLQTDGVRGNIPFPKIYEASTIIQKPLLIVVTICLAFQHRHK
jgi:hypothetical protein